MDYLFVFNNAPQSNSIQIYLPFDVLETKMYEATSFEESKEQSAHSYYIESYESKPI